jgi:hypothetical protein
MIDLISVNDLMKTIFRKREQKKRVRERKGYRK